MASLHRLVALFLLAWMPLQALAVPLLTWHCASHEAAVSAVDAAGVDLPCHSHDMAPADDPQNGDGDGDSGTPAKPGDFCCAHFSAVPTAFVVVAVEPVMSTALAPTLPAFSFLSRPLTQPPRG